MSDRFADSLQAGSRQKFRPDPARKLSANLYDIRGLLEKYPTVFFYANTWWIII